MNVWVDTSPPVCALTWVIAEIPQITDFVGQRSGRAQLHLHVQNFTAVLLSRGVVLLGPSNGKSREKAPRRRPRQRDFSLKGRCLHCIRALKRRYLATSRMRHGIRGWRPEAPVLSRRQSWV